VLSDAARTARAALVADRELGGAAFGSALGDLVDDVLRSALAEVVAGPSPWAVLAMGSYARRELAPASDLDVMLLHDGSRRSAPSTDAAGALWYPLWDAGFTLGQSVRSVKEAISVADDDLDALTALLDLRLVGGNPELAADLSRRVRDLAPRRRDRMMRALAAAAVERFDRPGPVAEMLEPDLKNGAGGLRDLQAPGWAGWALPGEDGNRDPLDGRAWDVGIARLVDRGYLQPDDPVRLREARARLLDARVALHRVGSGRSDRLPLQDQDAVATMVGAVDADDLVRGVGEAARAVVWITRDLWARLLATQAGPGGLRAGSRDLSEGVVLRDGRIAFAPDATIDTATVLRAAVHAARADVPFERAALEQLRGLTEVQWSPAARDAFVDLLGAGRGAIAVFETLDHVGVLVRLLPEWEHVRARPQRNAYHRFTVDRHSLEAVTESAALLDPEGPDGSEFDGDVARRARRDVLLLGALLHDIAKGRPGDHSTVGEETARVIATRIGVDATGVDDLGWLVRNHLLLVDTATRRDLADERTITRYAAAVGDDGRNTLLYALTVADSRATGPAAWNASKAALVRELFVKADAHLGAELVARAAEPDPVGALAGVMGADAAREFLAVMPESYARAFPPDELAHHHELLDAGASVVEWGELDDGRWSCTIVEPDRTGLLATAAGALALVGFDIDAASVYGYDGLALEVFTGRDRFDRLLTSDGRDAATETLSRAFAGTLALDEQLRDRARRYRVGHGPGADRDVRVIVDTEASDSATVVEVHAPDDVGLLARVAAVFVELDLDVAHAIVSTAADRVVDVFYLHDPTGRFAHRHGVESLRATLLTRMTTAVTLDERWEESE
jgi:[protein-PII] uridylyltransferase